ncbi:MAG: hypothetical protein ACHRXM_12905 [Isosphaerales bacterium]
MPPSVLTGSTVNGLDLHPAVVQNVVVTHASGGSFTLQVGTSSNNLITVPFQMDAADLRSALLALNLPNVTDITVYQADTTYTIANQFLLSTAPTQSVSQQSASSVELGLNAVGGTYSIAAGNNLVTYPLAWNASASQVQAALASLLNNIFGHGGNEQFFVSSLANQNLETAQPTDFLLGADGSATLAGWVVTSLTSTDPSSGGTGTITGGDTVANGASGYDQVVGATATDTLGFDFPSGVPSSIIHPSFTFQVTTDFTTGIPAAFSPTSGAWSLAGGQYQAVTRGTAISLFTRPGLLTSRPSLTPRPSAGRRAPGSETTRTPGPQPNITVVPSSQTQR